MNYSLLVAGALAAFSHGSVGETVQWLPTQVGLLHLGMPLQTVRALVPSAEGMGGEGCYEVLFDSRDLEALFPVSVKQSRAYMEFDGDQVDSRLVYIQIPMTDVAARRLASSYALLVPEGASAGPESSVLRIWSSPTTMVRFRFGENAGMSLETADAEQLCSRDVAFPRLWDGDASGMKGND